MADPFVLVPLTEAPPKPNSHRVVASLIALVLFAGVTAAILKPRDAKAASAALIRAASQKTAAVNTSHFTMSIDLTLNGQEQPNLLSMDGVTDVVNRVSAFSISGGGASSEVRVIGGVTYSRFDGAPLPDGKIWVRIDPSDRGGEAANQAKQSGDIYQQLELLNGAVGDPKVVGHETVDGVATTHYELRLDFSTLFDQMTAAGKSLNANTMIKALEAARSAIDLTNIPSEVWLDDEGRAREFKFNLHLQSAGNTVDEVADVHIGQFDEPVTVEVPPDDQVIPFSAVPDYFEMLLPK